MLIAIHYIVLYIGLLSNLALKSLSHPEGRPCFVQPLLFSLFSGMGRLDPHLLSGIWPSRFLFYSQSTPSWHAAAVSIGAELNKSVSGLNGFFSFLLRCIKELAGSLCNFQGVCVHG